MLSTISCDKLKRALDAVEMNYAVSKNADNETDFMLPLSNTMSVRMFVNEKTSVVKYITYLTKVYDDSKQIEVLKTLNDLNYRFKFVKFVLEDDNDIDMQYDLDVEGCESAAEKVIANIILFKEIADEAYPEILKAVWGGTYEKSEEDDFYSVSDDDSDDDDSIDNIDDALKVLSDRFAEMFDLNIFDEDDNDDDEVFTIDDDDENDEDNSSYCYDDDEEDQ